MSATALDRLLAVLVAALLVTGLLSLRAGSPPTAPLFVLHGVLAGSLLAAVGLKLWRSVPRSARGRRWGALGLAMVLALFTIAALVGGIAWVASGRILAIGPWTVMTLHAWAALCLVPILVAHLLPRRWRVLRRRRASAAAASGGRQIDRRAALGAIGMAVVGVAAWVAANGLERLAGGLRRFTGSRWLPDGGVPPATTFFGEHVEPLDVDAWRLTVSGRVARPEQLSLATLRGLGEVEREAVLDCTSGWALRTAWRGVALAAVLDRAEPDPQARSVIVKSATGWYASLPLDEGRNALLATGVAGRSLPHSNGAPCRLVAPDRRGLEWVKWVTEVEVA